MKRILLFLWFFSFQDLSCTTLRYLSFSELVEKSDLIIRASVQDSQPILRKSHIWTQYRLRVLEAIKGPERQQIFILQPGGVSGRYQTTVAGSVKLSMNNEICLFLWEGKGGIYQILGLEQGHFQLIPVGQNIFVSMTPQQLSGLSSTSSKSIQAVNQYTNFTQSPTWSKFREIIEFHDR